MGSAIFEGDTLTVDMRSDAGPIAVHSVGLNFNFSASLMLGTISDLQCFHAEIEAVWKPIPPAPFSRAAGDGDNGGFRVIRIESWSNMKWFAIPFVFVAFAMDSYLGFSFQGANCDPNILAMPVLWRNTLGIRNRSIRGVCRVGGSLLPMRHARPYRSVNGSGHCCVEREANMTQTFLRANVAILEGGHFPSGDPSCVSSWLRPLLSSPLQPLRSRRCPVHRSAGSSPALLASRRSC